MQGDDGGCQAVSGCDLLVIACTPDELPATIGAYSEEIPAAADVLLLTSGILASEKEPGMLPYDFIAEKLGGSKGRFAVLGGRCEELLAGREGATLVVGGRELATTRRIAHTLALAGFEVTDTRDVVGVQLSAIARQAALDAAAIASSSGPQAAGTAAGKVFAELCRYAVRCGAQPQTLSGAAGVGDLVTTLFVCGRHAGDSVTGQDLEMLPYLARALKSARVQAPALNGLVRVIEGHEDAGRWAQTLTKPSRPLQRAA
jgi:glycerol-3-phosphate dehydrogenase (NAD(P)+)